MEILLQPFWEEAVCECKFFFRTVIYLFVLSSGSMVQHHDRKLQVARAGGGAEQTQVQTLVTESRLEASFTPPAFQSGPLSTFHSLVLVSDTTMAEHSSLPSRGSQFHGDLSLTGPLCTRLCFKYFTFANFFNPTATPRSSLFIPSGWHRHLEWFAQGHIGCRRRSLRMHLLRPQLIGSLSRKGTSRHLVPPPPFFHRCGPRSTQIPFISELVLGPCLSELL